MPRPKRIVATDLTVAELKQLLAQKEQVAPLQAKKAKLEAELAAVEKQLAKLGSVKPARRGRKPGRKPGRKRGRPAAKKAGRSVARKAGKRAAKKAGRRLGKKIVRRVAKKAAPKRPATPGIQDVVVSLIRANGKPMAFQAILAAIKKGKLVKTKSKDFENVLRRTISGSKAFKREGRGIYSVKG